MIVRWGLASLAGLLEELGVARPLLVTTRRWRELELPVVARFDGVLPHTQHEGVDAAARIAGDVAADGLVALGGGAAIDTAKAVSAATGCIVVSIPTTYSGAEWTEFFGVRDAETKTKVAGAGARTEGIVYDPTLTVGLSPGATGGTALNALAHCAEALYVPGRSDETDAAALKGASAIDRFLPPVLKDGADLTARQGLLEGAMHAGMALRAGMGLGHAMAQVLGGRFGLDHGAMNAVCLPLALSFNAEVAKEELVRLGSAMGGDSATARVAELAALAGAQQLRAYGIAEEELGEVAALTAERPAATANPRPASRDDVLELLRSAW